MSVECYRKVLLINGINGVVAPRGSALEICRRSCTLSSGSSIVQAFAFREVSAASPDCCCKITVTFKMPSIAEWDEETAQTCAIAFGIIAANGAAYRSTEFHFAGCRLRFHGPSPIERLNTVPLLWVPPRWVTP